jgi:hypothetical protein
MRAQTLFVAAMFVASPAAAEDGGLGGFFSHLFGGPPQAPAPRASDAAPRPTSTTAHKPHKRSASREPREPIAPATPPATASKFVYVLGDSLAISAADGMVGDLQTHPDIGVVDRARDASGLVRDDYFDWPKAARDLAAPKAPAPKDKDAKPGKPKIDAIVVMLGINDKQALRDGKDYVDPLTDRWKAAYAQRIQGVVAPFHAAGVPVIWVGLPPMRGDKFNPQMIDDLNKMFKDNAEQAGAKFVDVFDGFADQSGGFDPFGPNIDGQKARLRGPDGIHLTAAGGAKLAHFIDVEVLAALGPGEAPAQDIAALPPDIGKAADDINEQIRREMGLAPAAGPTSPAAPQVAPAAPPPRPEAGAIASLAARPSSANAALATPAADVGGDAERVLRRGEPPRAAPGRADDFTR